MDYENKILVGDVTENLRELPDQAVNCCITSPPYWGLRDYGVAGQIGLEPTPQEYVERIVGVFREVRRVLRDDGTLWLNLGSSYARAQETNVPQTINNTHGYPTHTKAGASGRRLQSAPACGNDGKALQDSPATDSACSDLCDGCRAALSMGSANTSQPLESGVSRPSRRGRGTEPVGSSGAFQGASTLYAQASTIVGSSAPPSAECSHCANCGVCLSVLRSSTRDARLCARMAESRNGSESLASAGRNLGKDVSGTAWLNYTTFKPKDMVPIPWMVAMALQADGWWLRSDIIWAKPNPMPESVTDRPTKAHEYLFLLAKSERYYYDAEAIAERCADVTIADRVDGDRFRPERGFPGAPSSGNGRLGASEVRNRRTVWMIPTHPYPEAHFATFPEALIAPCVLAGAPEGGIVLDPFMGSGTTALVALKANRKFVGVELSPAYVEMAGRRIAPELTQLRIV